MLTSTARKSRSAFVLHPTLVSSIQQHPAESHSLGSNSFACLTCLVFFFFFHSGLPFLLPANNFFSFFLFLPEAIHMVMDSNPKLSAPIKFNGYDETSCAGFARMTRPHAPPTAGSFLFFCSPLLASFRRIFLAPSTRELGGRSCLPRERPISLAAPFFHGLLVL
jgi:hypothetical protein